MSSPAGVRPLLLIGLLAAACGGGPLPPPTPPPPPACPSPAPTGSATAAAAPKPPVEVEPELGPPHAFGFDDMIAMKRIDGLTVSADSKQIAFVVKIPDVAANKSRSDVWIQNVDGTDLRRLTDHPDADHSPRFAPDGRSILFLSARGGSTQVWRVPTTGGEAQKVTSLPVDVEGMLPFADGKRLALILDVYPDAATLDETHARDEARSKNPSKVRAFTALPVRHWDAWDEGKRNHIFVWSDGAAPIDVTKGLRDDAPSKPFGGVEEIAIAKDGSELVFSSKMVGREAAWSTNTDLWVVPTDGSKAPQSLTPKNPGEDSHPVFSPDGRTLAFLSMARPGYESDKRRVRVIDWATKKESAVVEAWDRSPTDLEWAPDSKGLFASADHLGRHALFSLPLGAKDATPLPVEGSNNGLVVTSDRLLWLHDALRAPAEVWTSGFDGKAPRAVTHLNDARVKNLSWGEPEQLTFKGAKGDTVSAWLIKPANMKPGSKVPVAMLIHGGPQGSFGDHFHYRWNPEIFAGHGFATMMIDFHGSTGYGQAFTDAIRGDWGGAPFDDLMKGLDAALAKYTFLDRNRVVAMGASYGGFMINWINGHTDRFKALVCHDGNLDEVMAYYETEELWFPEWEHGKTPWENPAGYTKHDPRDFVKNWKTPTLVVHGGMDFRVVETQGIATFTALQRRGVESRLLHFPDENHWVLKPANSKRWHEEVLAWIDRFTK
ncbi:MAG: S9 family peptidase [Labilithrix sp.]